MNHPYSTTHLPSRKTYFFVTFTNSDSSTYQFDHSKELLFGLKEALVYCDETASLIPQHLKYFA
jgi:hypothetical protein